MNCPKCNGSMTAVTVGEYTVDLCSDCRGLWFDGLEHEHVAQSSDAADALDSGDPARGKRENEKRDVSCPLCHVKMLKLSVPTQLHIKFESCPVCHGSFFDAGELKDFAHVTLPEAIRNWFPRRGGAAGSSGSNAKTRDAT